MMEDAADARHSVENDYFAENPLVEFELAFLLEVEESCEV